MDQKEFDDRVDIYLTMLTEVKTIEGLLSIVRDAAKWALAAHRADVARKAKR